jgi:phage-related holin
MKTIFLVKYIPFIIAGLLSFFLPIQKLLLATGILVTADIITGIIAAKKRGEAIKSKKMGASVTKTLLYFIAIILAHIMEQNFFIVDDQLSKATASIFAVIEFKSNLENISNATGIDLINKLKQFIETNRKTKED